jgi:hypothetical protein
MVVVSRPTAFGLPPALPTRVGDGVALWSLCCNGVAETAASLSEHKQLLPEERGVPLAHAAYYAYSVVPDGVVRVRWVMAGLHGRVTVWATVRDNAAVARVVPLPLPVLGATWYAVGGRVVATRSWNFSPHFCRGHPNRCRSYL